MKAGDRDGAVPKQRMDIAVFQVDQSTDRRDPIGDPEPSDVTVFLEAAGLASEMEDANRQSELAVLRQIDGVPAGHFPVLENLFQREIVLFNEHDRHPR